jgi:queuine tRNA-ribosyltransferase
MTPESSMQAQHDIGSDIHMAFDCPIGYGDTDTARDNAEKTLKITHDWAERCLVKHQRLSFAGLTGESRKNHMDSPIKSANDKVISETNDEAAPGANDELSQALYGVVQGGDFEDLRRLSAEFFAERDFDGYGIGGMYTADEGAKFLPMINRILSETKPKHWLGMGAEPRDLFVGVENGIDTFDCVAPTRQARNGSLYTHNGRINILNAKYKTDLSPIDVECECYTCQNHSAAYLHHLFKAGELTAYTLASIHNEYFIVHLVDQIRESIENENFIKFRDKFLNRYYKK